VQEGCPPDSGAALLPTHEGIMVSRWQRLNGGQPLAPPQQVQFDQMCSALKDGLSLAQIFSSPVAVGTFGARGQHLDDGDHRQRLTRSRMVRKTSRTRSGSGRVSTSGMTVTHSSSSPRACCWSLVSCGFQHCHVGADAQQMTVWHMLDIHPLFDAHYITRVNAWH
jgi:hypothetical protein